MTNTFVCWARVLVTVEIASGEARQDIYFFVSEIFPTEGH